MLTNSFAAEASTAHLLLEPQWARELGEGGGGDVKILYIF